MDFIDEATIYVRAGKGGDGMAHFRREKYVPMGGPDGGDGGKGGDVIFVANHHLSTLRDFKYRQHYYAEDGENGGTSQKTGHNGEDLIAQVPIGTLIRNADTGELLFDLCEDGMTFTAAEGGRGGKGNQHFATPTNQAPQRAQDGRPGVELQVKLELKLLADVAILGFPNAGKSTLVSSLSNAKPKVADYPFTTLVPQLGVVYTTHDKSGSFVLADIPGVIEGAHEGKGLGLRFLKHLERSRVLWILIDASTFLYDGGPTPNTTYQALMEELRCFNPAMLARKRFVILNKMDTQPPKESFVDLLKSLKKEGIPFYQISAATRVGLEDLVNDTYREIVTIKSQEQAPATPEQL